MDREKFEQWLVGIMGMPTGSTQGQQIEAAKLYAELRGWTNNKLKIDMTSKGGKIG